MRNLKQTLSKWLFSQWKMLWIVLTGITLALALLYNWHYNQVRTQHNITSIASELGNNLDGFIDDLFQDLYALPIYSNTVADCKQSLLPNLKRITLNNPNISGLIVSDAANKPICATLPQLQTLVAHSKYSRSLQGPFRISGFDQPVYLIQQKMGHYTLGVVVLASALTNLLKTEPRLAKSLALHNLLEKTNLLRLEFDSNYRHWIVSQDKDKLTPYNTNLLFSKDKLQSVEGVVVLVFENNKTTIAHLWHTLIYVTLAVLLLSFSLYYSIKNAISRRMSLSASIAIGIQQNEFFPEYQPIFNGKLGKFSAVEVLLRWRDRDGQYIMPDLFISEAEKTGLIVPITLQIMQKSLTELRDILQQDPEFHLGFNISAIHFTDADFFNRVSQLIKAQQINPAQILFEITERDLIDTNNPVFAGKMAQLRKEGYALAVDDYGTGHASISYLHNLPFDYLKIDKIFIQAIGTQAITESLNEAIIQMAKKLQLTIIAEGVETEQQVQYLREHGVWLLQGWFYSKALPLDALINRLKEYTK